MSSSATSPTVASAVAAAAAAAEVKEEETAREAGEAGASAEEEKPKVALITGITGQDGSYLAELLLQKGYVVHGIIRRASNFNTQRIDALYKDRHEGRDVRLFLHYGDMTDSACLTRIMQETQPDEIYNLAAMSHVKVSFEEPAYTAQVDAVGCINMLEAMRSLGLTKTRFYQASTSELYGKVQEVPQSETTPFYPRSPYAVAKLYAYWACRNYREAYDLHVTNGILFNHESPRRGATFVTRKTTRAVARIKAGHQQCLWLGNLEAQRDWGHARDYVDAMHRMLQQDTGDDYVVATNETRSVREFVERAFAHAGLPVEWRGERGTVTEVGVSADDPDRVLVRIDERYYRPTEVDLLIGDYSKARERLGWEPSTHFEDLVKEMVDADIQALADGTDPV